MSIWFLKVKNWWAEVALWQKIALAAFLLNFFLVAQLFLPNLADVNVWDESNYINSGKSFVEGGWPSYSWNPLVATFYGIFYLFTRQSPYWFLENLSLGRMVLFCLLWLATYLIAKELRSILHPAWLLGIAFVASLFTDILGNPSDALFASLAGLAFWQFLAFAQRQDWRNLACASAFLGLAALSRNDGLILFFVLLVLSFFLARGAKISLPKWGLAVILPFWLLVGGYVLTFWAVRGTLEFGTPARSYIAFMQGHQIVYKRDDGCELSFQKCAVADAIAKYGSPEANNNSIFRAILNNPGAYAGRFKTILLTLPEAFYQAYGTRLAYLFILLSGIGLVSLLAVRRFSLLLVLLGWPLYLGVYFLTFFRPGYLQSPFFILFILSAFGLDYLVKQIQSGRKAWLWGGFLLALAVLAGIWLKLPSLYFSAGVFLAAWLVTFLVGRAENFPVNTFQVAAMGFFLMAGLLVRGNYPLLIGRTLGQIPEERALLVLEQSFQPGTMVGAGSRGVVQAAKLGYFSLASDGLVSLSADDLYASLQAADVKGIYVDGTLSNSNQTIWAMIEGDLGTRYETLYSDDEGSIRVLKVK